MLVHAVRTIFSVNLKLKREERVLIFTDLIRPDEVMDEANRERRMSLRDITALAAEIARGFTPQVKHIEYPSTGGHGFEPPRQVWIDAFGTRATERLEKEGLLPLLLMKKASPGEIAKAKEIIARHTEKAVNVVVGLSNYSTSHTRFRDFLTRICKTRYASMPLFDPAMIAGALDVDYREMAEKTRKIGKTLADVETAEIRTPNGTRVTLAKGNRKVLCDTGILTRKGAFGNLPAGEVFFAPVEGLSRGRLVIEWASVRPLASPVTLIVEKGMVTRIEGDEPYAGMLREKLKEHPANATIAELGIGTNGGATRPDNIVEAEKILGTVHIALGDNSSFGGKTKAPYHQDFVFFKPTVTLKKKDGSTQKLIDRGELDV